MPYWYGGCGSIAAFEDPLECLCSGFLTASVSVDHDLLWYHGVWSICLFLCDFKTATSIITCVLELSILHDVDYMINRVWNEVLTFLSISAAFSIKVILCTDSSGVWYSHSVVQPLLLCALNGPLWPSWSRYIIVFGLVHIFCFSMILGLLQAYY